MTSASRVRPSLTLEEFLRLPEIDEHPYLEYIDGKVEAKVSAQKQHSRIQKLLVIHLDEFAMPRGLGESFPELRCTFAGRSLVPDVAFLTAEHIQNNGRGDVTNETFHAPDIHIEIGSPDQAARPNRERLRFSTAHGCPLGWFIDPERRRVEVYRPGRPFEHLTDNGCLDGDPVLPDYRLPVSVIFGWLQVRVIKPPAPGTSDPEDASS
jgi:Uma2 family endonuclease